MLPYVDFTFILLQISDFDENPLEFGYIGLVVKNGKPLYSRQRATSVLFIALHSCADEYRYVLQKKRPYG